MCFHVIFLELPLNPCVVPAETVKFYLFIGSFATATCMACKHKVSADEVREDIFNQVLTL